MKNYTCKEKKTHPATHKKLVHYMAKHQFEQCRPGSKLGHGCVPGNHTGDNNEGIISTKKAP